MDHAWKTGEGGRPFTCFFTEMKISAKKCSNFNKTETILCYGKNGSKREGEQKRTRTEENRNKGKQERKKAKMREINEAKGCLSAEAAYGAMYAQMYDLIISDIMMPGTDGFEFAKTVRGLGYKAVLK